MSKRSRERKQRRMAEQGLRPPPRPPISSARAPALPHKQVPPAWRGNEQLYDYLVHILRDSHTLRQEPEFRDLYFDLEQTAEVNARVMAKHEKKLREMANKSKDERQEYYDEVRIEAIEELATPEFRQEVLHRLQNLSKRLASGRDAQKKEIALMLQPVLQMQQIPWGICGLITSIYEASTERVQKEFEQGVAEVEKILQIAEKEGNLEKLLALPESSPEIAGLLKAVRAKPAMMKQLEQNTNHALDELEQAIARGEVELGLFTEKEVERVFIAMNEYVTTNQIDLEKADPKQYTDKFTELIHHSISEIMTPERTQKMKGDVERLALQWLREKKKQGALLRLESDYLGSEAPTENPFVFAAYVGQARKFGTALAEAKSPGEDSHRSATPNDQQPMPAPTRPHRGLKERITGIFRRR